MVGEVGIVKDSKPRREVDVSTSTGKSDGEIRLFHPIRHGEGYIASTLQKNATPIRDAAADEQD
jgi:hypothetical protein